MPSGDVGALTAGSGVAGKICAICQAAIIAGERIVLCPHCRLPFHAECWDENQGCSSYGCEAGPATEKMPEAATGPSNAWGGEKDCPGCGKRIKAQALKCRFCGAAFESRDAISAEQYARREYTGKEYNSARNRIIALFLLSAAGCLAPAGLVLVGVLLLRGSAFGIECRRLPAALKSLLYASLGIGCLLLLLMLLLVLFDG